MLVCTLCAGFILFRKRVAMYQCRLVRPPFPDPYHQCIALRVVCNTGAVSHIVNLRSTCPTSSSSPRPCAWTACTCSGAAFSLLCLVSLRAPTLYTVSCDTKGQIGWQVAKQLSCPLKACKATYWVVGAMLGPRPRLLLIARVLEHSRVHMAGSHAATTML